jgi:hypothetical protein
MKKLMIAGALLGLVVGACFGLNEGSPWPSVLWRGCIVSIGTGFLMRWWGSLWIRCLRESHLEQLAAADAAEQSLTQSKS